MFFKIYSDFSFPWVCFFFFFLLCMYFSFSLYVSHHKLFVENEGTNDSWIKHKDVIYFYCITILFFSKAKCLWRRAADCRGTSTAVCPGVHAHHQDLETGLHQPAVVCGLRKKVKVFHYLDFVSKNQSQSLNCIWRFRLINFRK